MALYNIVITTDDNNGFKSHNTFHQIDNFLRFSFIPKTINPDLNSTITLRVHTVGSDTQQLSFFKGALTEVNSKYSDIFRRLKVQYINNDIVKCQKMTPKQIVDWLMDSHIHEILGHVHQGRCLENNPEWNLQNIENEIRRLKFHLGDPTGDKVHCPIFLQDKYNYLAALKHDVLPTLKIPLIEDTDYFEIVPLLTTFCQNNVCDNTMPTENGYVLKLPYTTNQKYSKLTTVESIRMKITELRDDFVGTIPYVMLQVYLHDTVEYKVVCFNGKALYETHVSYCDKVSGLKKSFSTKQGRFEFAESIIQKMIANCAYAEMSSLVRVDIFQCNYLNKMVVNELETLEARIDANNREANKEIFVQRCLSIHHANRLLGFLGSLTNQNLQPLEYPTWPKDWDILDRTA